MTGSVKTYYHRNQQYSVIALTSSTGAVQERYAYTAYGEPTITNATGSVLTASGVNNRYMYTGREWDNVIGQYHYRARMYDAGLGRFCSRDPIAYWDGLNAYSSYFVLSKLDPSGLVYEITTHTNCAGFALSDGDSLQMDNNDSILSMANEKGWGCTMSVSASDCRQHCEDQGFASCAMGYAYINRDLNFDAVKEYMEELIANNSVKMVALDDSFMEHANFLYFDKSIKDKFGKSIDFHFLRCDGDDYLYQPCHAKKGSDLDKRRKPDRWTPNPRKKDYFGNGQMIGKMCCCQNPSLGNITLQPSTAPMPSMTTPAPTSSSGGFTLQPSTAPGFR